MCLLTIQSFVDRAVIYLIIKDNSIQFQFHLKYSGLLVFISPETLNITSWLGSGLGPPGEALVLRYLATFIKLTHPSQKVRIYATRRDPGQRPSESC